MINIINMKDYDSSEAAASRADQDDPIIMYLIVRESLGMGMGKTAAQCAHASQMLLLKYMNTMSEVPKLPIWVNIFHDWLQGSFRKIVLKADDKEWLKIKELPDHILVIDAGLTEVPAMSETCIGFVPMRKSSVPKVIKKLQLLK